VGDRFNFRGDAVQQGDAACRADGGDSGDGEAGGFDRAIEVVGGGGRLILSQSGEVGEAEPGARTVAIMPDWGPCILSGTAPFQKPHPG
jgi:hypothetical protein